jgi:hypothetical protein
MELYIAACDMARCAAFIEKDQSKPIDLGNAERGQYATRAVQFLREAIKRGFNNIQKLKSSPDLALLRNRDDFQKLLKELEENLKSQEPQPPPSAKASPK